MLASDWPACWEILSRRSCPLLKVKGGATAVRRPRTAVSTGLTQAATTLLIKASRQGSPLAFFSPASFAGAFFFLGAFSFFSASPSLNEFLTCT